jgi:hypothetical protein
MQQERALAKYNVVRDQKQAPKEPEQGTLDVKSFANPVLERPSPAPYKDPSPNSSPSPELSPNSLLALSSPNSSLSDPQDFGPRKDSARS